MDLIHFPQEILFSLKTASTPMNCPNFYYHYLTFCSWQYYTHHISYGYFPYFLFNFGDSGIQYLKIFDWYIFKLLHSSTQPTNFTSISSNSSVTLSFRFRHFDTFWFISDHIFWRIPSILLQNSHLSFCYNSLSSFIFFCSNSLSSHNFFYSNSFNFLRSSFSCNLTSFNLMPFFFFIF